METTANIIPDETIEFVRSLVELRVLVADIMRPRYDHDDIGIHHPDHEFDEYEPSPYNRPGGGLD
jgi:hypothetical protein